MHKKQAFHWLDTKQNIPMTMGELLSYNSQSDCLVVLLDEADKLVDYNGKIDWETFNSIRSCANSGRIQFVICGEKSFRTALLDSKSPLFNFGNEMFLGTFDATTTELLIKRSMGQLDIKLKQEDKLIQKIFMFSSGHPNIIQRICRHIVKTVNERRIYQVTENDIDSIIQNPLFQRDEFLGTYWEAATILEKIVSLAMSTDPNLNTLKKIHAKLAHEYNLPVTINLVDEALQLLVSLRSILHYTPQGYEFAVRSFPSVIANTITSEDLVQVLNEQYFESVK